MASARGLDGLRTIRGGRSRLQLGGKISPGNQKRFQNKLGFRRSKTTYSFVHLQSAHNLKYLYGKTSDKVMGNTTAIGILHAYLTCWSGRSASEHCGANLSPEGCFYHACKVQQPHISNSIRSTRRKYANNYDRLVWHIPHAAGSEQLPGSAGDYHKDVDARDQDGVPSGVRRPAPQFRISISGGSARIEVCVLVHGTSSRRTRS